MVENRDESESQTDPSATDDAELPSSVIERSVRLTRQAREAVDDNEADAYRQSRDDLLAEHEFTARVRAGDNDVLVMHPAEWVEDGDVVPARIDDIDRGIECALEGTSDPNDWESVDEHNRAIAGAVETHYEPVHAANAQALATFMSNHYAKPIEQATGEELREFLDEYFRRNAWPTENQQQVIRESLEYVYEQTDVALPLE